MLIQDEKVFLLKLVREVIIAKLENREMKISKPKNEIFNKKTGAFVTLHKKNNDLRGCIGYIRGYKNLFDTIKEMAEAAAFRDPRFQEVQSFELNDIVIEISILSDLIIVNDVKEIEVGRDGLFIESGINSGLLLPQVAKEWNWNCTQFLNETCHKAGLSSNCWKDKNTRIYRFSAEIFSE